MNCGKFRPVPEDPPCQIVAKDQLGQAMLRARGQAEGCNEANVLAKHTKYRPTTRLNYQVTT